MNTSRLRDSESVSFVLPGSGGKVEVDERRGRGSGKGLRDPDY